MQHTTISSRNYIHPHFCRRVVIQWLLRSDGTAVAIGRNVDGQCSIPALDRGITYTHISAGGRHTVLLRNDGTAVAIGRNVEGQCSIPPLDQEITYTQISAGAGHTVLFRSDGTAVAIGKSQSGTMQHFVASARTLLRGRFDMWQTPSPTTRVCG